jgi:hypothetical protein
VITVSVVLEDGFPAVAAIADVIDATGIFNRSLWTTSNGQRKDLHHVNATTRCSSYG